MFRFFFFLCILLATFWDVSFAANIITRAGSHNPHRHHGKGKVQGCQHGMRLRLLEYQPSNWEHTWSETLKSGNEQACAYMKGSQERVSVWVDTIQEINNMVSKLGTSFTVDVPPRKETVISTMSTDVFSVYTFENECPGELQGLQKKVFIEPLVGHMRHPLGLEPCTSPESRVDVMDVSYLFLNPWPTPDFQLLYPGKKYLLDCGTSTFDTSLMFLTTRYRQSGVEFDEIWAWEAAEQSAKTYWESVPDIYKQRLHYYNTPITSDVEHADHPLSVIRSIYRPGDFIAIKLDIDNSPLETVMIDSIVSDPDLLLSIGELFYEQHYDHPEMAGYFGLQNRMTLDKTHESLTQLRELGLIVHYWP